MANIKGSWRSPVHAVGVAAVVLLLGWGGWWRPLLEGPPTSPTADTEITAAIRGALPYLATEGLAWLNGEVPIQDGQGCVSCHQVPFGVWSLEEAAKRGITADESQRARLARGAVEFIARPGKARAMSWGPLVVGDAIQSDSETDSDSSEFMDFVSGRQNGAGYWEARGQFPSQRRELEETNQVSTLWTMLALASLEGSDVSIEESLARADRWLRASDTGRTNEWLLLRSVVATERGDPAFGAKFRTELLDCQNPDGGWGWAPGEESNALTTGQVLYFLNRFAAGGDVVTDSDPVLAGAERYLLRTRDEDGLWAVSGALISREGGSGKDYVYKYWATAWATIGLSQALDSTTSGTS